MPRPSVDPALGRTLLTLREDRGYSQERVAHAAGLTVGAYGRIELGQSAPGWSTVRALAEALGVSLVDLAARVEREDR